MLSLKADVSQHPDCRKYALALRAIGQDLADMSVNELAIEVSGGTFVVSGTARMKAPAVMKPRAKLWPRPVPSGKGPVSTAACPFQRTYSMSDIRHLEDTGRSFRAGRKANPDIYVLAERLRTIGRIVEAKGGRLIQIFKDANVVRIEYQDENGVAWAEEHSSGELFRSQQDGHLKRGTVSKKDSWEDAID